jgi:hypothetical protein
MGAIIGRAIGYLLLGAVVAPLLMLAAMIPIYLLDSRCGTPGDSGGCEMSIAVNMMMMVVPGAVTGLIVGLWRGVKAKKRAAR